MDKPEKFMMQFVQQNDINANGKKSSQYSLFNRMILMPMVRNVHVTVCSTNDINANGKKNS